MKPSISLNLFIRALTILSLCAGLIGVAGLTPRSAQANVQPSCSTTPLFTNGTFITGENNGAGGADTSSPPSDPFHRGLGFLVDPTQLQTSFPSGSPRRARLADDFTVTSNGWRPSALTFYAYQTYAISSSSSITGVIDLRLWNGTPGEGGEVIAGPVDATITNNQWTGVYRAYSNDLGNTDRPIMAVTVNWPFSITTLLPGTYWIEWGMAGSPSFTGPWVPAVSFATSNNARQLDLTSGEPGTWAPRGDYDVSDRIAEFPFVICGDTIPTPQITSLSPDQAVAGGAEFTLTVNGSGFIDGTGSDRSVVHWNGSPITATNFISSTQLTATIPASNIATAGTANVTVVNPGNLTSNTAPFTITNPLPTISSISPATTVAGSGGFTLTITGTNFVTNSVVRWNGSDRLTTFVSSTRLEAAISASDVATAGTANVTVFNPTPGGGESGAVTFTINNPAPTISSISPATAVAGNGGFTLTITGTNFVTNSVVRWNGSNRTTTFVSSTQLTAAIPASDVATAGTANVTVFNPAPGGGTSNTATFTITNPSPTITTISPATTVAGSGGFTLTITGTNFVTGAVVRWNGNNRTTGFVSSTVLTATIPASDVATAGTANVTVFNPAPGGGESGAATFTITNPSPTISSISPATAVAGSGGFTLTITGTNFVNGAVVRWNGSPRPTTFVSSTQLTAAIPASDIATAGTANVTVFNPAPGGGESGAVTFTIQDNTVGSPQQYRVMLPLITR
ncbi:beta strand repeat-containing protein [Roseiflexus sp. RS-1]|uniref:beta strand repeat-containing protein n=1 Tax=Roseiflexus sp. (strain RS-1) TaxID=357808 RepID=UPI0000D8148D|nr:IPT/TIG domain-containing protein [Roseiflexus sp. RS-1]ABQ89655.1 cell surface receptor IPT/TIG domain protein [Roseiflexus sp. RS-1]